MAKEKDQTSPTETIEAVPTPVLPPKPSISATEAAAAHEARETKLEDDKATEHTVVKDENFTPTGHFRFGEGTHGTINLFGLLAAIFAPLNPLVGFVLGIAGIYVAVKAGRDLIGWIFSSFAIVIGAIALGKMLFLLGVFFSTQPMPMW